VVKTSGLSFGDGRSLHVERKEREAVLVGNRELRVKSQWLGLVYFVTATA